MIGWQITLSINFDFNISVIEKGSDSELGSLVSWCIADSLEVGTGLNIWSSQETISRPSVLVDTVYKHGVVIQLGESDGDTVKTCLVVHHTSLNRESEYAVLWDSEVLVEVAVMVWSKSW